MGNTKSNQLICSVYVNCWCIHMLVYSLFVSRIWRHLERGCRETSKMNWLTWFWASGRTWRVPMCFLWRKKSGHRWTVRICTQNRKSEMHDVLMLENLISCVEPSKPWFCRHSLFVSQWMHNVGTGVEGVWFLFHVYFLSWNSHCSLNMSSISPGSLWHCILMMWASTVTVNPILKCQGHDLMWHTGRQCLIIVIYCTHAKYDRKTVLMQTVAWRTLIRWMCIALAHKFAAP